MTNQEFYENHLKLLADNDVNVLVEHDYHDDAEMILHVADEPIHLKGKEALLQQLGDYLKYIYRGFISTEKLAITDDSIFLEATINTTNGPSKVYDALYMKDGKIFRHYSGLK
ncbi:nuclear transport factor 2 family protein [Runella sp. MFBS21]|uniref:nuclear transport factor 2 family protein n=1 Tax=Runella sp. MFBS21 TaxID=3034018 RepID=UPI0023F7C01D|nr:nuclear transport factor 2 family protein [Runella sp. MFBS21]MDF7819906.1 nuclear transport factor 2 family protein [Runella sp. MFBS21]